MRSRLPLVVLCNVRHECPDPLWADASHQFGRKDSGHVYMYQKEGKTLSRILQILMMHASPYVCAITTTTTATTTAVAFKSLGKTALVKRIGKSLGKHKKPW